jgi:glycosyltransferase involved in cell wall biosynthesis
MSTEKTCKILLNAMVANESNTIIRMLESCYKFIDFWVIQDNGSTDNTIELIQNFMDEKNSIPCKKNRWDLNFLTIIITVKN